MAAGNEDIWLNWLCSVCGQRGTKYGPSYATRQRKVSHPYCKKKSGVVIWTGCSNAAFPLLCDNLAGTVNVVAQPIKNMQNDANPLIINDENESDINEMNEYDAMDQHDESSDENDKENVSANSNTNNAAGSKRSFEEMISSDEISSHEKFKVCISQENKRLKTLRPFRMAPRHFKISKNCHLLHGKKDEHLLHLDFLQDNKPSKTTGKLDKISKERCRDKQTIIKKFSTKRKDNNQQMAPGGQYGSTRKFDPTEVAQQIDGRNVILKYTDKFPKCSWF
eukprot:481024_1